LGDRLHFSGTSFPYIMNSSVRNGFKIQKSWPWWGAVVVATLAVVLFWSSHEKDSAQTAARQSHNPVDDQKLVLTDSGQRHQDATAQVRAEPVSQPSDTESVESVAEHNNSGGSRDHVEMEDRSPRPFTPRQFSRNCLSDQHLACQAEQALLKEPIDPNWSSVTEGRLRDLWRESVAEMSDEFLYVECKTTACEVTYRFPQEIPWDNRSRYFDQFWVAFQASDLAAELRYSGLSYGGIERAAHFRRKTSQREPQASSKIPQ
jgi:hypothetical protein